MRSLLMIILVVICAWVGYKFYPELYKALSGKDAPLEAPVSPSGNAQGASALAPASKAP